MHVRFVTAILVALTMAGCSSESDKPGAVQAAAEAKVSSEAQPQVAAKRGGTVTVGEQTWVLVASSQCSIYPGNVVHISGHAESDPSLEIVIDHDATSEARIGPDSGQGWHAVPGTLVIDIDGRHIHGKGTFSEYFGGRGESAEGSFDVDC